MLTGGSADTTVGKFTVNYQNNSSREHESSYGTYAPAQTFSFTLKNDGKPVKFYNNEGTETTPPESYPAVTLGTAVFSNPIPRREKNTVDVDIAITNYTTAPLGTYYYSFNLDNNHIAGTIYTSTTYYLKVIVLRDTSANAVEDGKVCHIFLTSGDKLNSGKVDEIGVIYQARYMTITKKVSGSMADRNKSFPFTITLKPSSNTGAKFDNTVSDGTVFGVQNKLSKTPSSVVMNADNSITYVVMLKHGETLTISNIPDNAEYSIYENKDSLGVYTITGIQKGNIDRMDPDWMEDHPNEDPYNPTGEIHVNMESGYENYDFVWTNTLEVDGVDTGVITESAPYILLIALCAVTAVLFLTKRRKVDF